MGPSPGPEPGIGTDLGRERFKVWTGGRGSGLFNSLSLPGPQVTMRDLGATGQPGLDPGQEPTVTLGGWLSGHWGLQSHVPF